MATICILRRWAMDNLEWDEQRIYSALRGMVYSRLNLPDTEVKYYCLNDALNQLGIREKCNGYYRYYKRTAQSEEDEITIQKALCIIYSKKMTSSVDSTYQIHYRIGSQEYIANRHDMVDYIFKEWEKRRRILLEVSPNSGKSSLAIKIAKQRKTLIIAPYRTIVDMYVRNGIPEIKGGDTFTQSAVCTTDWYAYYGLSIPEDVYIIIDESHLLSLEDYRSVRPRVISQLNASQNMQLYLTATVENETNIIGGISKMSVIKERKDRMSVLCGETKNFSKCAFQIANRFKNKDEKIVIVSDCSWKKIFDTLLANGVYKDDISIITSNHIKGVTDNKCFDHNDAKDVLAQEHLTRKWTIMTRVAYAGVNFHNNKKTLLIVELDETETTGSYPVQAAGRIRDGEVSVVLLWNKKFKKEDPDKWQSLYSLVESGKKYVYNRIGVAIPFKEYTEEVMKENVKTMKYKRENAYYYPVNSYFKKHQHLGGGSFFSLKDTDLLEVIGEYDLRKTANLREETNIFSSQIRDAAKNDMDFWLDDRSENHAYIPVWKNKLMDIEKELKKYRHSVDWASFAEYIYGEISRKHRGVKSVMEDLEILTLMYIDNDMLRACRDEKGALEVALERGDKKPESMAKRLMKLAKLLVFDNTIVQWSKNGVALNVKDVSEKRREAGKKGGKNKMLTFIFSLNYQWIYRNDELKESRVKRLFAMRAGMDDQVNAKLSVGSFETQGKKEAEEFLTALGFGSRAIRRLFETPKEKYKYYKIENGIEVVCWFNINVRKHDGSIVSIDEWIKQKKKNTHNPVCGISTTRHYPVINNFEYS